MTTENINLAEMAQSNTFGQWLDAFNANMGKIDALPLPVAYGKNTTMEYLKLSNGKAIMWGRLHLGSSYPCSTACDGGYKSDTFTIDFPIALSSATPTVLSEAKTWPYVNQTVFSTSVTYTTFTGCFFCPSDDTGASNMQKICHLLVIGDWK